MLILKQNLSNTVPTPPVGKGTIFLNEADAIAVKTSDGNVQTFPTVSGANTEVFYNSDGGLEGSPNFTWNNATSTLTISTGNVVATGVKTDNLYYANGTPWDLQQPAGSTSQIQFNDANSFGASANFTWNNATNSLIVTGNANVSNNINAGNVSATGITGTTLTGNLTTAAQPNITSVGSLTNLNVAGNAVIAGNLVVDGNVTYVNVDTLAVEDPVISLGGGPNGAPLSLNDGKDRGTLLNYFTTAPVYAFMGWDNSNAEFSFGSNVGIVNDVVSYNTLGNIRAATVIANVSATTVSGTLTTAAQPNVTSVGTLTGLAMSGNITPATTNVYTLGNSTHRWNDLYLSGNTIYLGDSTISTDANLLTLTNGNGGSFEVGGNSTVTTIQNGNSNISVTANGNVTTSVNGTANVVVVTNTGANVAGTLTATGNITGDYIIGNGALLTGIDATAIQNGTSNVRAFNNANVAISAAGNANIAVITGTGVNVAGTLNATGNANVGNIGANNAVFTSVSGNGSALTAITGANVTGTVANATYAVSAGSAGTATSATTAGTVTTAAQPNITSVGTLSTLSVTGNANVGNIGATNGVFTNVSGNGSALSAVTGANVTGTVANATYAVSAGSATTAGTVTTAAQPNITSVGTLSSLTVTGNTATGNLTTGGVVSAVGNVSGGNIDTGGRVVATGNVSGGNLTTGGRVVATGNVSGGNLTTGGALSVTGNANVGNIGAEAGVFTGNVIAGNLSATTLSGTLTTAAQPNITSIGSLTNLNVSGNAVITGNLTVDGTVNYVNVDTLAVEDPVISLGNGPNNTPLTTNDGKDRGTLLNYYTTAPINAFMGWDNSNAEFSFGSNVSVTSEVVTFNSLGNVRAGNFIGNGAALTAITGGNVTGQVANALVAGTVYTAAQPNITSVGTLSSLTVTNKVTAGQLQGDGGNISNIQGANVSGTVASATNAGTATLANTINVTTQTSGNAYLLFGNALTGTVNETANATFVANTSNGALYATTFIGTLSGSATSAGSATTAGTVTTAAQPNITSVGTLTSLAVTGNLSAGNITTGAGSGGSITGANLVSANFITGTLTTAAQPNITSVGTLSSLSVTGALTTTNITAGANTTAGTVTGNWTLTAGSRWQSTYADVAERYQADSNYEPGTVVVLGGEHEVTVDGVEDSHKVAGVVTTNPAYIMNLSLEGENVVEVALIGRVPCKVVGPISKGDLLTTSSVVGHAYANNSAAPGRIIGKALENFDGETGTIEVMVGRT